MAMVDLYLYKYSPGPGGGFVKTSAELKKLFGLSDTQLSGFRRDQYLHPRKVNGEYQYPEKDYLVLERAVPEWREGKRPCVAFPKAEAHFDSVAQAIFACIAEYKENHSGYPPSEKRIQQAIAGNEDAHAYIEALLEANQLAREGGGLTAVAVYRPAGLLAYKSTLSNARWWIVLPEERRMAIREISFGLYLAETRNLPEGSKIPVPVDSLLSREGINVEYRNLDAGRFGLSDPSERTIYGAVSIRKNRERRRLVLMHEYFHLFFNHTDAVCSEEGQDYREAEATYAAVHYLVPFRTFEVVANKCTESEPPFWEWIKKIARVYQVPADVIVEYHHELLLTQGTERQPPATKERH